MRGSEVSPRHLSDTALIPLEATKRHEPAHGVTRCGYDGDTSETLAGLRASGAVLKSRPRADAAGMSGPCDGQSIAPSQQFPANIVGADACPLADSTQAAMPLAQRLIEGIQRSLKAAADDIDATRRPSDRQLVMALADDISAMLRRRLRWTDVHGVLVASGLTISVTTLRTYHRHAIRKGSLAAPALKRAKPILPQPFPKKITPTGSANLAGVRRQNILNEDC